MYTLGIDAMISRREKSGVEWYTHHLLREMQLLTPPDWRMLLYSLAGISEFPNSTEFPNEKCERRELRWPPRRGWGQMRLSWEMMRRPPNVLFMPQAPIPFIHPHRPEAKQHTVTTIHDVGFLSHKDLYAPADYRRQMFALEFARKHASLIFAPSEATKKDLIERAKFRAEHIHVTPLGINASLPRLHLGTEMQPRGIQTVLNHYGVTQPYLLYVGRIDAKKNLVTLLQVARKICDREKSWQLVLVGSKGYGSEKVERMIQEEGMGDWVKLLGWVREEDLLSLYARADAFVFPSSYEGFGLPVLEALACGVPTVCSDIPALREVAGDAALFAPPLEVDAWSSALQKITSDEILRSELRRRGLIQAEKFSWKRTAELTWQGIQDLLL